MQKHCCSFPKMHHDFTICPKNCGSYVITASILGNNNKQWQNDVWQSFMSESVNIFIMININFVSWTGVIPNIEILIMRYSNLHILLVICLMMKFLQKSYLKVILPNQIFLKGFLSPCHVTYLPYEDLCLYKAGQL